MSEPSDQTRPDALTQAISLVLNENSLATLITIIETPRRVGAKMLVEESGTCVGTLGDASLDQAVSHYAAIFLASRVEAATYSIRDFAPHLNDWLDTRILCERIEPEPRLVICGAGHVGASLARLACLVGYSTVLIDDRAEFVTRARFPDESIELVLADSWTNALLRALGSGRNVAVAVVTRGHNEDEECMRAVINTRPDYVGLIGSRRRTNIVLERLRESGADEILLNEVRAPIGLDIGAVSPEEVALAILAEVVATRRGAIGSPLSLWRRSAETRDRV